MEIGWGNGIQEIKGFWRTKIYLGEEIEGLVEEKL